MHLIEYSYLLLYLFKIITHESFESSRNYFLVNKNTRKKQILIPIIHNFLIKSHYVMTMQKNNYGFPKIWFFQTMSNVYFNVNFLSPATVTVISPMKYS